MRQTESICLRTAFTTMTTLLTPHVPVDDPRLRSASFERLWLARSPRLRRFARRLASSREDADDLLHDSLLLGFRAFASYDRTRSFDNWMMAIIQNRARYLRRRRPPASFISLESLGGATPDGEGIGGLDPSASILEAESLAWSVARLKPFEREIVGQIAVHGLDYHAIAKALGVPLGTVRSRIYRTRESLKATLGDALYDTEAP